MRKNGTTFLFLLFAGLFLGGQIEAQINYRNLPEFPAFKLKDTKGTVFSTTAVLKKDKPTVLIYFSPTCHHCQTQTTDITSNIKLFKDVQFLFVTSYPPQDYQPFLNEYAIEKFSNITFGYDSSYAMVRFLELESLPGVFVYNKDHQFKVNFNTNIRTKNLYSAIFE